MAMLPAMNPAIPLLARIPGGLHHGTMIRVIGKKTGSKWTFINIQNGSSISPSDDTSLHISIRPENGVIVRNHKKDDHWGREERSGGCPIRDNERFEILILVQNDCFKIAVNGRHFCEFVHRIPFHTSNYFFIKGDVHVTSVTLENDLLQASAPPFPMNMSYQSMAYQPPPTHPQSQFQPMQQQHIQSTYPQYGSVSATTHATPAASGYPIQCTHYYIPNAQPMPQQHQYSYSNPNNNVYGQHHYQQNNTSKSNTMLKYATGIGGIGLGAYALSYLFDNDSHECADSD